jgi:antitoxin YefM
MQSVLFEEAKQNLDTLCKKACQDHEPYIVHRQDNNNVVILSLEDFNAWQETQYLLSTPANAHESWEDYFYWQQTDKQMLKEN